MATDREIVKGLLEKNDIVTKSFFFTKCRPLMYSIINYFFNYPVNYDELINELYVFLMEDDGKVLRSFRFESTLCQWLKRVAYNFFFLKKNRDVMIDNSTKETPYDGTGDETCEEAKMEISMLLPLMRNSRNRMILEKLFIEGYDYDELSKITGLTKANLYNIKKRALHELLQIVSDERR